MRKEQNMRDKSLFGFNILKNYQRPYLKDYVNNPPGYAVVPENMLERVIFTRLHNKGKLDSHLMSARNEGMVSELLPGGAILFRNKKFGWKKVNVDDFDLLIHLEYMDLRSEMENNHNK